MPKKRKDPESWKDIPTSNKHGNCFDVAAKLVIDNDYSKEFNDPLLVHGEVAGQGPLEGIRFGHAWVEDGNVVIDKSNGKDLKIPKLLYYALGNIEDKKGKIYRYNLEETRKMLLKHAHYGPWDLKTKY